VLRRLFTLSAVLTSLALVLAAVRTCLPVNIAEPLGLVMIWLFGFAGLFGISFRELSPHLFDTPIEVLERAALPFVGCARAVFVVMLPASGLWLGLCSRAPLLSGAVFFAAYQLLSWAGKKYLPGPVLPSYGVTGGTVAVELAWVVAGLAAGKGLLGLVL
jgi:hypothetical protein